MYLICKIYLHAYDIYMNVFKTKGKYIGLFWVLHGKIFSKLELIWNVMPGEHQETIL